MEVSGRVADVHADCRRTLHTTRYHVHIWLLQLSVPVQNSAQPSTRCNTCLCSAARPCCIPGTLLASCPRSAA